MQQNNNVKQVYIDLALLAFTGAFWVQIKFSAKQGAVSKVPNIDRITRGLGETILTSFVMLFLILGYFIYASDRYLTALTLLSAFQLIYFIGGARSAGLFSR